MFADRPRSATHRRARPSTPEPPGRADVAFAMERVHRARPAAKSASHLRGRRVARTDIADGHMAAEPVWLLQARVPRYL